MFPRVAAAPALSPSAIAWASARRQIRTAAVAPSCPNAATPARRRLSARSLAARAAGDQRANRATSRSRKSSCQAAAQAAAIRRARSSSLRASVSPTASRTPWGRARISATRAESESRAASTRSVSGSDEPGPVEGAAMRNSVSSDEVHRSYPVRASTFQR